MPALNWDPVDLLDYLEVEPAIEEYEVSHTYLIERNKLILKISIFQFESVVQLELFRTDSTCPLFQFAAFVRGSVIYNNDKLGRFIKITNCVIGTNRFFYIYSGDPFDQGRFPVGMTITLSVYPDIEIEFHPFENSN
jgi:hypothetical protein